jgi:hypothetical protein
MPLRATLPRRDAAGDARSARATAQMICLPPRQFSPFQILHFQIIADAIR